MRFTCTRYAYWLTLGLAVAEKSRIMLTMEPAHTSLLTTREVGERLRLAPRTIRFWVERGWLNPVRLTPRSLRFRADEIEQIARYGRAGVPREDQRDPVDPRVNA
jgi:hypothetical protein